MREDLVRALEIQLQEGGCPRFLWGSACRKLVGEVSTHLLDVLQ
jgi:hypothetical protein